MTIVDYPRDSAVHLMGRLSGSFYLRENSSEWRFQEAGCHEGKVQNVARGWDLMGLLRAALLPSFGLADACLSNKFMRVPGGLHFPGVDGRVRCPEPLNVPAVSLLGTQSRVG